MRHTEWISSLSIKQFISDLEILLLIVLSQGHHPIYLLLLEVSKHPQFITKVYICFALMIGIIY
jgi:hypothetical protein